MAWMARVRAPTSASESHVPHRPPVGVSPRSETRARRAAVLDVASARLGDPDPLAAVMDAIHFDTYDEVVVSTMPRHVSRWLRLSLPHRVGAATGLPVTHVVGSQTRLVDRADERRHGGRRSVYLDGQGAARVLGVDEAAAPARGTGQ